MRVIGANPYMMTVADVTSPTRPCQLGNGRKQISPTTNVDKIRSALMVAHGKNDPRVPFAEAEQIAAKVHAAGRPVWTVYADNEGHGFQKKENVDYLRAVETLFLKQHLQIQ